MANQHFHLFETAIGTCALAWEGERFIGAQLPEGDEGGARQRDVLSRPRDSRGTSASAARARPSSAPSPEPESGEVTPPG